MKSGRECPELVDFVAEVADEMGEVRRGGF
jgi:hypothetical protein